MPLEVTFRTLRACLGAAKKALDELSTVSARYDRQADLEREKKRPDHPDLENPPPKIVDDFLEGIGDTAGEIDQAIVRAEQAHDASHRPDLSQIRTALAGVHKKVLEGGKKYANQVSSHTMLSKLEGLPGRDWNVWVVEVKRKLGPCTAAIEKVDAAVLAGWKELAERLTAPTVIVAPSTPPTVIGLPQPVPRIF